MANIALVDDHALLRDGLARLIKSLEHTVVLEAANGKDFINMLDPETLPELVLMDINMPVMDGYETTLWLKQKYPNIIVMALSMYDNETAIIRMMKCGAKGYVLKDSDPSELKEALESIFAKGFYYSDVVNTRMIDAISNIENGGNEIKQLVQMTDKELEFLKLVCTELTYKDIAEKMDVGHRTLENYRDSLFEKLGVKTRIGLAMFAVRNGVVQF